MFINDIGNKSLHIIVMVVLVVFFGIIIFIPCFINRDLSYEYFYHYKDTSKNVRWAPGTFEDAQRVVTGFIDIANPDELSLSYSGILEYRSTQKKGFKFTYTEIIYDNVAMFLSKKDYEKYYWWLKDLSKPYKTKQKLLTTPEDPTWNNYNEHDSNIN